MVSKLRIIWKQTVVQDTAAAAAADSRRTAMPVTLDCPFEIADQSPLMPRLLLPVPSLSAPSGEGDPAPETGQPTGACTMNESDTFKHARLRFTYRISARMLSYLVTIYISCAKAGMSDGLSQCPISGTGAWRNNRALVTMHD